MFKKIVDILEKECSVNNEINNKINDVKKTYAPEFATKKVVELQEQLKNSTAKAKSELDLLVQKHDENIKSEIEKLQKDEKYIEKRKEAMNIIFNVGSKLEKDLLEDILKDIVEAKDLKTLRILEKTKSNENKRAYEEAITTVEEYINSKDLNVAVREAKMFLNNKNHGINMPLRMAIYNNDISAYEKLITLK